MKRIILLRHGHAESLASAGSDLKRKLDDKGIRQISVIGKRMEAEGIVPDYMGCSNAERAQMSAGIIKTELRLDLEINIHPQLYGAAPDQYFEVLRSIPDIYSSVMLVAHNPGMEDFVSLLIGKRMRMDTAELFTAEFKIDRWKDFKVQGLNPANTLFISPGKK